MRYTCIDSFSGAGGLSLGLSKAGFEILFSFDIDELSIKTQKQNSKYFNHEAVCMDITQLNSKQLMKQLGIKRGELTLFAGGPPCQGFSIQRIGEDSDDRNNLVFEFMKKVVDFLPNFFLMENVPGITGKRGKKILEDAIAFAEQNGYSIHRQILNAQDYEVPQRRKRLIIVGERVLNGKSKFNFPKPGGKKVTVRDVISKLPEPPIDGKEHEKVSLHRSDKLSKKNIERIKYLKPGQGREFLPDELLADCHKIDSSIIGHRNVYGRMSWDEVAPTITARFDSFTRGLFGHPEQHRSISLREGALLQTFPMDFNFCGNKVDVARQIGNAVPPKLAYEIGKKIIQSII
jgi:DNA (cytosine-5)-methyltransferase 1